MPSPRDVLELIEKVRRISSEDERHSLLTSLEAVDRHLGRPANAPAPIQPASTHKEL